VKSLWTKLSVALLLGVISLAPTVAKAQTEKLEPIVVVSVESVDNILEDVKFISSIVGTPDDSPINPVKLIALTFQGMTIGLDTTKAGGGYMTVDPDTDEPIAIGFLPLDDLDKFLGSIEQQVGKPKDLGGGLYEFTKPQEMYMKDGGGWLFVAAQKEHLSAVPAKPLELLAGLDKEYDVSVSVNMRNIPAKYREMAVKQMQDGFEQGLENQPVDGEDRKIAEKIGKRSMESIVSLIEETETMTIGLTLDETKKSIALDIAITALEGTDLARQMALQQDVKSSFGGFLMPEAAVNLHLTSTMAREDIETFGLMLQTARKKAMEEIDNDDNIETDAERDTAKRLLGDLMDVVDKTVKAGKMDGGAALILKPEELTFVAGGFVADGKKLEKIVKEGVSLAKDEPDFPEFKFDVDTYKSVSFHTAQIPLREENEETRKLFGDKMLVAIGTGEKSLFVAFGKDPISTIKSVMDKSAAASGKDVEPMQLVVALTPIAKFAASMDGRPMVAAIADEFSKVAGKDHIFLTTTTIDRGQKIRLEIEGGVLEAASKMGPALGGPPGGGGGFPGDDF
jgi:hypothetical protein